MADKNYRVRTLTEALLDFSKTFKVILMTGPRQVGKTTLLKNAASNKRKYVTLDNPADLLLAKSDPELFFEKYSPPVFIDEIQYAPELFKYIKILVDNSNQRGAVWLTGSQQYNMMQGITESLAGRVAILNLLGFSIYERENKGRAQSKPFLPRRKQFGQLTTRLKRKNSAETFQIIWQGFFPEVITLNPQKRAAFYAAYIKTYLERDVRQLVNIGDESAFLTFLKATAARTGQLLNLNDLAANTGISPKTAKHWLSILQTAGLVYLLKPYFKNITKRLSKTPKLYFMDTGLAAYLADWNTPEALETGAMAGAFFETFVVTEIIKSYYHTGHEPQLYYYRDAKHNEIDLLIHQDGLYYPVEIKKSTLPGTTDIKAFKIFGSLEKLGYGNLICQTREWRPLNTSVSAIPVWNL
ncbi:ATPase [Candidatus Termititenax aidoneus]|uniref:ATPase n=1 Tax=Termititenax aidoneus TaxID=2218524 RepID=A0A388TAE4_TERA1|nr:ATPase [Candidatus Termititenax aidoneus]